MKNLQIILLVISSGSAMIAAVAAWRSAAASYKALRFGFIVDLIDLYSTPETLAAVRGLFEWYKANPSNFASLFAKLRQENYEEIKDLDIKRRKVKFYFFRVFHMRQAGVLDDKQVRDIVHSQQAFCLLNVIHPIELAINPKEVKQDKSAYDYFTRLFPHPEKGQFE